MVDAVNARSYGLTFGIHRRVNRRIEYIASRIHVGNIYVNRNQIDAIVGSQPFGGEGLSGTGPKAGGPLYVRLFLKGKTVKKPSSSSDKVIGADKVQKLVAKIASVNAPKLEEHQETLKPFFGEVLRRWTRAIWKCPSPPLSRTFCLSTPGRGPVPGAGC